MDFIYVLWFFVILLKNQATVKPTLRISSQKPG
jgi:hypothetical protein